MKALPKPHGISSHPVHLQANSVAGLALDDEQTIRTILTGIAKIQVENAHLREQVASVKQQSISQVAELKVELAALREQHSQMLGQLNRWRGASVILISIGGGVFALGQWALSYFTRSP